MLPRELYDNPQADTQITNEAKISAEEILAWKVKEIKWGKNGIEMIIEGADFPARGYAPPEAVFANNIVKRLIIEGLPIINPLRFQAAINAFASISWKVMSPHILKAEYLTPFSREIQKMAEVFLREIKANSIGKPSRVIAHLFEYDNAYRLRLEDLFNETTPELLKANPRQEIARLLKLNKEREIMYKETVSNKFKIVANLIGSILYLPKYRQAFNKALDACNYKNLCIDNIELYWMCHRTDYNFCGKTYEERLELLENAGYKLVKGQKYNV